MMLEDEVSQLGIIEAAKCGSFLLRNNSFVLKNQEGTPVRAGLGNISHEQNKKFKSSDQIGITPTIITQEMVGKTIGIFTAVEFKKEGWKFNPSDERELAQLTFIEWVIVRGGLAGFAASIDDVRKIIRK